MVMNMKTKQGKGIILCLVLILFNLNISAACADMVSVPVNMEVEAMSMDFEITESVNMRCAGNSNVLTVDDLVITNTPVNPLDIEVSRIALTPQGGWQVVADATDYSNMVNIKCFSLVMGDHDFYEGSYLQTFRIASGESRTISFTGHTGYFNEAVSEKAADFVVTITPAPQLCSFEIRLDKLDDGRNWVAFYAEEGMTWGEWVESEYNTEGFVLCGNGGCHILHPQNYTVFDTKGTYLVKKDAAIVTGYRYQISVNYETYD